MRRKIILIDEDKCDGCGLCASACAEGAISIVDGKARLIDESFCDGLGACLGECPRGAITIVESEAAPFDPLAVVGTALSTGETVNAPACPDPTGGGSPSQCSVGSAGEPLPCGCPGTAVTELPASTAGEGEPENGKPTPSRLGNWPVQLRLVPAKAYFLKGARILLAADCTAFAFPDFNRVLLEGRVLLVGCPKLDDAAFYREKLADILSRNEIDEVTVVHMEVPCCFGLASIAVHAAREAGRPVRVRVIKLSLDGRILDARGVGVFSSE